MGLGHDVLVTLLWALLFSCCCGDTGEGGDLCTAFLQMKGTFSKGSEVFCAFH